MQRIWYKAIQSCLYNRIDEYGIKRPHLKWNIAYIGAMWLNRLILKIVNGNIALLAARKIKIIKEYLK